MHTPCCKPFRRDLGTMLTTAASVGPLVGGDVRQVIQWDLERTNFNVYVQFNPGNINNGSLTYRFIKCDRDNGSIIFTAPGGTVAAVADLIANQRNEFSLNVPRGTVGIELRNGFDGSISNVEIIFDITPDPVTLRGPNPQSW